MEICGPVKKHWSKNRTCEADVLYTRESKHGFESQSAMRRWWFHDVGQTGVVDHDISLSK